MQLQLSRQDRLPPRVIPLLYFALAYLSIAAAFLVIAIEPERVAGFFYHPRMVFVVHLVTLGWITSSILGALYLVGPMALRAAMPEERRDYLSFALYFLGASGIVFHFWLDELSGVGLSGILVMLAVALTGCKFLRSLMTPRVDVAIRAHFILAFLNFGLAALLGVLLAFNKIFPFLPGYVLTHVFAHAHLAGAGWAVMMVFAAGYRLLPMLLPAAMPTGRSVWASAVLLEVGVLGLVAGLLIEADWRLVFACIIVAGIFAFFSQIAWMKMHARPAPKALRRPDWGVLQALQSFLYLAVAACLGLVLLLLPMSETWLRLALVYGTCALVGFLAQAVVGISARLLPLYVWLRRSAYEAPNFSPHSLPDRRLEALTALFWSSGVPVLAVGFFFDQARIVGWGGGLLLAAVVAGAASSVRIWVAPRTLRQKKRPL